MLFNIFVRFEEQCKTQDGKAMSWQPRIWRGIIHNNIGEPITHSKTKLNIRDRTRFCWLSKFPDSLNLEIELDPKRMAEEIADLKGRMLGAVEIGFFNPNPAAEKGRPVNGAEADIIPFPLKLSA